ncbi:thioredoxin [candidate division FCPU426 bacterium]|nr:thioredoxin [candidate division FCPU426 bacterium]
MADVVNSQTFSQEVEQAPQAVLIDFYADWCGPCKMIAPILEEIAKERGDIKVVKVNVDEAQDLAQRFNVMSIPMLVLYKNGKMIASWIGLRPKPLLLKEVDAALAGA